MQKNEAAILETASLMVLQENLFGWRSGAGGAFLALFAPFVVSAALVLFAAFGGAGVGTRGSGLAAS
jgi:hypothetical protein